MAAGRELVQLSVFRLLCWDIKKIAGGIHGVKLSFFPVAESLIEVRSRPAFRSNTDKTIHLGMHIGLFFGSFNPVHVGHMVLANYMLSFTDMQEVWFVVSPHNPLKSKSQLLEQHNRYLLVQLAIDDHPGFRC